MEASTLLSEMDRSHRQKIIEDTGELNNTIDQQFIIHINILFHTTTAEYTFFPSTHGIVTRIDHSLGHKTHLTNLEQKSYIICSQITVELKLEINNRKITRKSHNIWRLNNTLLNNTWVKEELSVKIF